MRVLVTGCSPGIGGATCLVLAEAGGIDASKIPETYALLDSG